MLLLFFLIMQFMYKSTGTKITNSRKKEKQLHTILMYGYKYLKHFE